MVQLIDYPPLFCISVCVLGFRTSLRNMTGKTVSFSDLVFLLKQIDWLNHCGQARNFQRESWEGFVFGCRNLRETRDSAQQDVNLSSLISANNHSSSLQAQMTNINKMWLHYWRPATRGRRIALILVSFNKHARLTGLRSRNVWWCSLWGDIPLIASTYFSSARWKWGKDATTGAPTGGKEKMLANYFQINIG